jgi:hypothetical protein
MNRPSGAPSSTAVRFVTSVLVLASCSPEPPPTALPPVDCDAPAPTVVWKRVDAFANDVGRALELEPDELCTELGTAACVDVHRVALGGTSALEKALYRPFAEPAATTPLAIERLVHAACVTRVDRDREGDPAVFRDMPLGDEPLDGRGPGSPFAKQAAALGSRFFGRDLSADELLALEPLGGPVGETPTSARDAALLLCFTLGTSSELAFF